MMTSSGSASSRMRGSSLFGVAAHAQPFDAHPALGRIVVEEADRREPQLAVSHDLAGHHAPTLAGARDQHRALAARPAEREQRPALVDAARDRPHPHQEHERQQREQHDHAVGQDDRDRVAVGVLDSTGRSTSIATTLSSTITATARTTAS